MEARRLRGGGRVAGARGAWVAWALLGLALALSACRETAERQEAPADVPKLAALAKKMRLEFPARTRVLGLRESDGMDDAIFLKVELPLDALDAFLAASPLRAEEFSEDRRYLLGPDDEWWDPNRPQALPTAQAKLPGAKVLDAGIDRQRTGVAVLYLFWHET